MPNTPVLKQTLRLITLFVCALPSFLATTVHGQDAPQTSASERAADYSIKVTAYFDSATLADFGERIKGYLELRTRLDSGVPTLRVTIDPDQISEAEDVLGDRIRVARVAAKQGDIFDDVEYRLVGRHLILRDTRANIIDEIPFALTCRDCEKRSIWSRLKGWTVEPRTAR